ncbi:sensor histidine kinase [Pseudonocardia sp. DSM 110487]|uniref:sensor histidine kinase n=1 Tax=Pseudonocardia sp. DSM 110487 TaxID=2865833 RepID=UPI002105E93A|nr:sensor histidine kinase [Pseudonocardia sp. DSM 110487]
MTEQARAITSDAARRAAGMLAGDELDEHADKVDSAIERVVPYAGLVIGTALTPIAIPPTLPYWLVTGSLVLVTAAWSSAFVRHESPCAAATSTRRGAVYMVGLLALMAVLTYQSPFYAFQAFAGYVHSFAYLHGRWRWVGIVVTATMVAYSQLGGSLADSPITPGYFAGWIGLILVNVALGGGFTYLGMLTSQQSQRRREMIVELNEANRRLSDTMEENAALHVRLLAQAREAGVLDERARLAREIHDTIAQGLTGIVTQLEAAGVADGDPEVRRRHIDTASALARESLTEARRSVDALGPRQLVETQLPDAIADMAKRWAEARGVELILDTTGDPRPLLPELEVTLFRAAQEALTNVGKHAGASRVGLTLSYMDDVVVLDVRDDGRGFVPEQMPGAVDGSGFGLVAMEQRVRRVAGTVSVESAPGEGTALSASVPAIPAEVR